MATAQIEHPHVVSAIDLVMQLVRGASLEGRLHRLRGDLKRILGRFAERAPG